MYKCTSIFKHRHFSVFRSFLNSVLLRIEWDFRLLKARSQKSEDRSLFNNDFDP